jgi:mRNA interferase RelE/StbE
VYTILFTPAAAREFSRLRKRNKDIGDDVEQAIDELSGQPRPRGVVKLRDNIYRVRVGDYRVIYSIEKKDKVILVSRVRRRTETTYRGI